MKTNFNFTIVNPCGKKWSDFTPTSTGGFCNSCSKNVIDFTKRNDDEISAFFMQKPAHTCGRFRKDQLRTNFTEQSMKINPGMMLFKTGLLALTLVFINKPVSAQAPVLKSKTEITQNPGYVTDKTSANNESRIVKGVVRPKGDDSVLPGVNVLLKGGGERTVTDSEGRFEFPKKLKAGEVLMFTFIGLETQEYLVSNDNQENADIRLSMEMIALMGDVAIGGPYQPEATGFARFWGKVKRIF